MSAGTDQVLIVWVLTTHNNPTATATYNSVAMTAIGTTTLNNGGQLTAFRLVNPTVGTANIGVTLNNGSNAIITAAVYEGVNQTTPVGNVAVGVSGAGSDPPTHTLAHTRSSNDSTVVIASGTSFNVNYTSNTATLGTARHFASTNPNGEYRSIAIQDYSPGTTGSSNYTNTRNAAGWGHMGTVIFELMPAAPAGSPTSTPTRTPNWTATISPTHTVTPVTGNGLCGEYFNNNSFTAPAAGYRTDATVNFNWGGGNPGFGMNNDNYSVRWTGQVRASFSETYTFYGRGDDGIRVWVNGVQLINQWTYCGCEVSGNIALTAGSYYDVVVEFREDGGNADVYLQWSSSSTPKAVVPQASLYSGTCAASSPTPTRTNTPFQSPTRTPVVSPTRTASPTGTPTRTPSFTPTRTNSPIHSPTRTLTPAPATPTQTLTPIAVPMTKSVNPSSATIGSTITYCISWQNNTGGTTSVTIWDTVPLAMTYLSCFVQSGSMTSCSYSPRLTVFNIGASIPNGGSGVVCFRGVVSAYPWLPGFDTGAWLAQLARDEDIDPQPYARSGGRP